MNDRFERLAIIGFGGFAAEVVETAQLSGWSRITLYDDDRSKHGKVLAGFPCEGSVDDLARSTLSSFFIAIGSNSARQKIAEKLEQSGHMPATVRHPLSIVSSSARITAGAFVGAHAWVGPNVSVGRHALINSSTTIGHDTILGHWIQLCPGVRVSGFARLGDGVFVGSNAVIGPNVILGEWSRLGATSFARRDVPPGALAVGSPAQLVRPQ
jgi:sugar O-acyltransferase (sialic acid O-acetyltransferase NeuD family)